MSNKELIITLIQQDLKHTQLTSGLDKAGLDTEKHHLQLLELVSDLMEVPEQIDFDWGQAYYDLLQEAEKFEIGHTTDALRPYAELCYRQLSLYLEIERMKTKLSNQA